jgi:hypothetical protein
LKKRKVTVQSRFVLKRARKHILARRDELLAFRDCLAHADQKGRHHEMRIAAKRLRYTMEICSPAYDDGLKDFVASVKDLQTLLGEIHDCDVWVDSLDAFLRDEKERIVGLFGHDRPVARLKAGIDHLAAGRRRRREELFEQLGRYWAELERHEMWDRLRETVRGRAERSKRVDAPGGDRHTAAERGGTKAATGHNGSDPETGSKKTIPQAAEPAQLSPQTET